MPLHGITTSLAGTLNIWLFDNFKPFGLFRILNQQILGPLWGKIVFAKLLFVFAEAQPFSPLEKCIRTFIFFLMNLPSIFQNHLHTNITPIKTNKHVSMIFLSRKILNLSFNLSLFQKSGKTDLGCRVQRRICCKNNRVKCDQQFFTILDFFQILLALPLKTALHTV